MRKIASYNVPLSALAVTMSVAVRRVEGDLGIPISDGFEAQPSIAATAIT
jgi:hypothetical protein